MRFFPNRVFSKEKGAIFENPAQHKQSNADEEEAPR
jgi:hypothetical protein